MNPYILPITGYLDRFSHRPGEVFRAHVALRAPGRFRAQLQRVVSADPNPAGPGMDLIDMSHVFDWSGPGHLQPIQLGSHAIVDRGPTRLPNAQCQWSVLVWSARYTNEATVFSETDDHTTLSLVVTPQGAIARLAWPEGTVELAVSTPMLPRHWYRLSLDADPGQRRLTLSQQRLDEPALSATAIAQGMRLPTGGPILFAAESPTAPQNHFTGKLEAPRIATGDKTLAAWDFAQGIATQEIIDTGPQQCHGRLINLPTRAVVGAHWTGAEMCWRHKPEDYAAIHFHDDDLGDCNWHPSLDFPVPADLPSGAYALHLTCAEGEDWLPLYILPNRTGPFAELAVLASTFTYQAYANHARNNTDEAFRARVVDWSANPNFADDYPIYGRSTYNRHRDGSGIAFSSRLRPVLTMRPGYLTFNDANGSGLRHYPADTHLLAWLESQQLVYDIITDEDLDEDGTILAPYRAVLTGSHPEYHTLNTLDALQAYTKSGGRLAYLGGNGFYWRIARTPSLPGIIELRRAEGGIRAWAAEPGEYHHQLDGQYGGLWRRNRRPPQMLAGVGFSGQGLFEGTHYRRLPASHAAEFAWMFAGIEEDRLGDYGLSGGGAAGFELDRADITLGTPENAVILARSEDAPSSFITVPEELLSHLATVNGESPAALMRGEIVYFDTPSGGAVFAVGSITFCGSLWQPSEDGFTGPISQLLENVVQHFLKDPPLPRIPPSS